MTDPHRTPSDINLVSRAVRERWSIPADRRGVVVARLLEIVEKRTVDVMTKEGPASMEGPADSNANAAARVLVAMEGQNQADDHLADKNARLDDGKPTENVASAPVVLVHTAPPPPPAKDRDGA